MRIVVKLGTSVLTQGTRRLNRPKIADLTRQCVALQAQGHQLIICTSGAVAAGREQLGFPDLSRNLTTKQMLSAVGQSRLMQIWGAFFDIYDVHVAQMLLTRADIASRQRYLNARDTLRHLLTHQIVPIINENDAVANEEIKVGDNDNLSALVALLAEADLLLLLTDQDGLFTADPRHDQSAELIREVHTINDYLRQLAGGSVTGLGTGGMVTKIESAEIATRAGIDVIIANGNCHDIIIHLVNGEQHGTRFIAQASPLENRKQWLFAGSKTHGTLVVDAGAAQALQSGGRSLLPAGIIKVSGNFTRGETVAIETEFGQMIGRGIARYSSRSMQEIMGRQSAEIEDILGYTYGKVAVHRNDLILL
jgi:glutamate 5-kinase